MCLFLLVKHDDWKQGEEGLSSADILRTREGFFRCGRPHFLVQLRIF